MSAIHDCGFELVNHPHYSPDLALLEYYLFPNMKTVPVRWLSHICCGGLLWRPEKCILKSWNSDFKTPLEEVCL